MLFGLFLLGFWWEPERSRLGPIPRLGLSGGWRSIGFFQKIMFPGSLNPPHFTYTKAHSESQVKCGLIRSSQWSVGYRKVVYLWPVTFPRSDIWLPVNVVLGFKCWLALRGSVHFGYKGELPYISDQLHTFVCPPHWISFSANMGFPRSLTTDEITLYVLRNLELYRREVVFRPF